MAEITFKAAVITSSAAKITFAVAEITFKVAVITSSVVNITFPSLKKSELILRLTKKNIICSQNSLFVFQMGLFYVNNSSRTCLNQN